ncbi:LysM domain protein [Colletotrichum phormii]|uniref:LysM domain protein n=1 Tax=Colletotrichum phormii TaxID=359342 RepID=A0AAI9ZDS8_9PEZI|nr:LysM domain protein [Colletotrichum phormii]KAK1622586.1 LysM domain protein [Colletotrichum phormii]
MAALRTPFPTDRWVGRKTIAVCSHTGYCLTTAYESVLYQTINCDPYVKNLGQKVYHGSPGDTAFTGTVCSATCSTALSTARRRIAGSCASTPELFQGYPVLSPIDSITAGWNETCLKDANGGYCNAKIEAFDDFEELVDMPKDQLCSFCYGEKLRMMQRSPYSTYDSLRAETLQYINENCGGTTSPTDPQLPVITPNGTVPETCATGVKYTAQAGDTCNSIAKAKSISGSSLYYINPSLVDCDAPAAGSELCLPLTCETTYDVKEGDGCVAIGVDQATTWQNIIKWNSGVDDRCSNIWSSPATTPYWGNVICVSAPGEIPDGSVVSGNGTVVDPPSTGTVAQGTTELCGQYFQVQEGATCSSIIAGNAVPINLFLRANHSLRNNESCSQYLRVGLWYCLLPVRDFDSSL